MLDSSHGTADPELVTVLTSEAPEAIAWLESIGVEFSRDGDGYRLARCGGASIPRLLQVGDRTGHAIAKSLRAELDQRGIAIHDHTALVGLERPNGHFEARLSQADVERRLEAGAVVLAAGGRCYAEARDAGILTTNQPGSTGEATTLARALGAEVCDYDALQHHPTGGAWPPPLQGYSIPETCRSYGAHAPERRRASGSATSSRRATRSPRRSCRECDEGRGLVTPDGHPAVHLDTTAIDPEIAARGDPAHAAPLPRRGRRPAAPSRS